jgi:hypothetical protein
MGEITILPNMNNVFNVTTDTFTVNGNDTTYHQTKRILIDQDPSNSLFEDSLLTDRLRAIAWKEGAGTEPELGHPVVSNPWNHYWFDTFTPCENKRSTATGIMQFLRKTWEKTFSGHDSTQPGGYYVCKWDSLAWNWRLCIRNGKYIFDDYLSKKYKDKQWSFPDSCPFSSCNYFPSKKNKEDLRTFGYTAKHLDDMQAIQTDADWANTIGRTPPTTREAKYAQDVRRYRYEKPWN